MVSFLRTDPGQTPDPKTYSFPRDPDLNDSDYQVFVTDMDGKPVTAGYRTDFRTLQNFIDVVFNTTPEAGWVITLLPLPPISDATKLSTLDNDTNYDDAALFNYIAQDHVCLLYTSPSPRDS